MKYGKRYVNPERWITPRFRKLPPITKLMYQFITDNCDWAGFMPIDEERIAFETGIPIDKIKSELDELNEEEITLSNGWLFVLDFIEMQGNSSLSPNNPAHKNIIDKLGDNSIHFADDLRFKKNVAPYEPLLRVTCNGNGNSNCISKGNGNGNPETNSIIEEEKKEKKPIWKKDFKCTSCGAIKGDYCKLKDTSITCMANQSYNNRQERT